MTDAAKGDDSAVAEEWAEGCVAVYGLGVREYQRRSLSGLTSMMESPVFTGTIVAVTTITADGH